MKNSTQIKEKDVKLFQDKINAFFKKHKKSYDIDKKLDDCKILLYQIYTSKFKKT